MSRVQTFRLLCDMVCFRWINHDLRLNVPLTN